MSKPGQDRFLRDIKIRAFRPVDLPRIAAIDKSATALLADHGFPQLLAEPAPTERELAEFMESHDNWVAADTGGAALGYAAAVALGDLYWLREVSVDPEFGRRGLGGLLLEAVSDYALRNNFHAVGLSTFRDVPFNRPFYEHHGFVVTNPEHLGEAAARQFAEEVPAGIDPASRVAMVRIL